MALGLLLGARSLPRPPHQCGGHPRLHLLPARVISTLPGAAIPAGARGCPRGLPHGLPASFPLVPLSFWDWEKGEKLDYFHNGNPRYTRVTAMEYLNGQDCSLLLTATGEWGPRGRRPRLGRRGGRGRVRNPVHVFWQRGRSSGRPPPSRGQDACEGRSPHRLRGRAK